MPVCKLCLEDRELCDSHIIPEFMYKPIYDDKHRLHELSSDPHVANKLTRQKGLRERLLCQECEGHLSVYERYASMVWHGGAGVTFEKRGRLTIMNSLDYETFKLFEISILWRAAVASGEFFGAVKIGNKHESTLRKMIRQADPGEPHEYGCITFVVISDDVEGKLVHMILTPERIRMYGHTAYRFLFGSVCWIFIVSSHSSSFSGQNMFLQTQGSLLVPVVKAEETELFTQLARVFSQQGKLSQSQG